MYTKSWLIIKDEKTRTFEVVSQADNDNAFTNKAVAMQRDGMQVSSVILPVSNKHASKEAVMQNGYMKEEGLYNRLLQQHQAIILNQASLWDDAV